MYANVGRGHVSHNFAIHLAHENNIDILLLQELWIFRDLFPRNLQHIPVLNPFRLFEPGIRSPEYMPMSENLSIHALFKPNTYCYRLAPMGISGKS